MTSSFFYACLTVVAKVAAISPTVTVVAPLYRVAACPPVRVWRLRDDGDPSWTGSASTFRWRGAVFATSVWNSDLQLREI